MASEATKSEKENQQGDMLTDKADALDTSTQEAATSGKKRSADEQGQESEGNERTSASKRQAVGGEKGSQENESNEAMGEVEQPLDSKDEDHENDDEKASNDDDKTSTDNKVAKESDSKPAGSGQEADPPKSIATRPVKRARTAYFIFMDEKRSEVQKQHPGEGVAAVARAMGQIWSSLPAEEKQVYQEKAAAERERVAKEMEAWKAAGGVADLPSTGESHDGSLLILPVARIRKICKLDPDVRNLSKEALLLVSKAAELATAKLGKECVRVAQIQNRRKLLPDDVAQVCASREQFLFLREDIQDLAKQSSKDAAAKSKAAKLSKAQAETKPQGKPLTDYFPPKPKN